MRHTHILLLPEVLTQPYRLAEVDGDWHEFESKAHRKENERKDKARRLENQREKEKEKRKASALTPQAGDTEDRESKRSKQESETPAQEQVAEN